MQVLFRKKTVLKILFSFVIVAFLFTANFSYAANEFTFAPRGFGLSHCAVLPVGIHPNCGAYEDNENERPHIEAPDNIVVEATAFQISKEDIDLGDLLPDDNYTNCAECELPEVTNNAPDFFPLGDTLVIWTANFPIEDEEESFSATAEQLVTITDNTNPQFTNISELEVTTNNPEGTPLFYTLPTASDAVGIQSIVCDPSPGSTFDLGVTEITCTATDNADNTTIDEFSITVTFSDDAPPQFITSVKDLEQQTENSDGVAISYVVPDATDDSGIPDVFCNPPPGSIFEIGTTVVTCTATDGSGNENSMSFQITINLPEPGVPPPVQDSFSKNTVSVNPIQAKVPSSGKTSEISFSGNIENYQRGNPVTIEIFDSLNLKSTFAVFGTDGGSYQFSYPLTDQNPSGKYTADILYQNQKINSLSFALTEEIESEGPVLPSWIKLNAGWWTEGKLDDKTFLQGIEYMIKEEIIKIPNLSSSQDSTSESADIPEWIKLNAGWWEKDLISDNDFIKGIEYLVSNGIIIV